jgi:hypothetical protein
MSTELDIPNDEDLAALKPDRTTAMFHNSVFSYRVTSSGTHLTATRRQQEPFRRRDARPSKAEQHVSDTTCRHVIHHLRHVQQTHYLERRQFF